MPRAPRSTSSRSSSRSGRLVGLIVPEIEALREGGDALRQSLRTELEERSRRLASYQRLSDFAITAEALPRTQIGKLRRHELGPAVPAREGGRRRPRPPDRNSRRAIGRCSIRPRSARSGNGSRSASRPSP